MWSRRPARPNMIRTGENGKMSRRCTPNHTSHSSAAPCGPRWLANQAPLSAPTEVPTMRSGAIPAADQHFGHAGLHRAQAGPARQHKGGRHRTASATAPLPKPAHR